MKVFKWFHLLPILLFFFFHIASCAVEKGTMNTYDAWAEIYTAIDRKAAECGNHPPYFLPVFNDPQEYGVRLCSLSIIRQACPFNDYPLFCVEMLGYDLPLIGP